MSGMNIGLSGLTVAQRAIEIVSTNIANASTEGYHRQTPVVTSISTDSPLSPSTGGAQITEVSRAIDRLLENEILRNQPIYGQLNQELTTLQAIESSLGSLGSQAIVDSLSQFFSDIRELSAQPQSTALQQQAVWSAESLCQQFNSLGSNLQETSANLRTEISATIDDVNGLTSQIADLNTQVLANISRGGSANLLMDQRDQLVLQLADLLPVQTRGADNGTVDIMAWGAPLVIGSHATEIRLGADANQDLGVSFKDSSLVETDVSGGRLGAMFDLQNNVLSDLRDQIDALANQIVVAVNSLHVQGVGSAGAFDELTGSPVGAGVLAEAAPSVQAGSFAIRVTDADTGAVTRTHIDVDPETDSLADIAARLDALDHITCYVTDSRLRIQADDGCTFDFRPGVESQPTTNGLTGTGQPTVSGNYDGTDNVTYTFTVRGSGQVGITDGLSLEVRDDAGNLVNTLAVGSGYAAGDSLDVARGVSVALSLGTLTDGEPFTVEALARSDTSGLLAAAGINTLFSGTSATTMAVNEDVLDDPGRLAVSSSIEGTDNLNALAMAELEDTPQQALGGLSPAETLQLFITGIGQRVSLAQSRQDSAEQVMLQLQNRRDAVSGVDVNEQAADLMILERLFQACSKVITAQDQTLQDLLDMM
jgi:flagellar hook-associated protein 1